VGSWQESLLHLHYKLGAKKPTSRCSPFICHRHHFRIYSHLLPTRINPSENQEVNTRVAVRFCFPSGGTPSCPSCIKWLQAMFVHLCTAASWDKHHNPQHSPPPSANCAFHGLLRAIWLSDAIRRQQCSYHLTAPTPDMPPPSAGLPPLELPLSLQAMGVLSPEAQMIWPGQVPPTSAPV